jgi:hypothetical protein
VTPAEQFVAMLEGSLRKLSTLVRDGVFTEQESADARIALRDALANARLLVKVAAHPKEGNTVKIQGNIQSLAEAMAESPSAPVYPQYPPAFISMYGVPFVPGDTE